MIPLIQAIFGSSFFSVGSIFWSIDVVASYVLFGVVAVATLVCLIVKPVRIIGWGLLFAVLMTLCFGAVAYSYVVEHL